MESFKSKIKGIQVINLFSNPLDEIKQNIIDKVNIKGFEKSSISNCYLDDESQHVIDQYLSENGELIKEFLAENDLNNESCIQSNLFDTDLNHYGFSNTQEELININSIFEETLSRKKKVDLKLYSQLNDMFQPFCSTLDQFEQIKENIAEIVSFLGGNSNSNSDGYCRKITQCSKEFNSLNRILLNLYKKKRICSIIDKLEKLNNLKLVQSNVHLLLNEKEYDQAINIIDESLETLVTEMKGIKAVNTLSTQLYEMQSVIEKLVCQDFIHFIITWLKYTGTCSKDELFYSKTIQNDFQFELFINPLRNLDSITDFENLKVCVFQEFNQLSLTLYKQDNVEFSSKFNINSVMNPIITLIKKGRINLAIDELEVHLNNLIDETNEKMIQELRRNETFLEHNNINTVICSNIQISHQSLEVLLSYNILNILYKLIFIFSIIIHSSRFLQENCVEYISDSADKSLKHIYLPISQLLEQVLSRIFSKLLISIDVKNLQKNNPEDDFKYSNLYYKVFLKYVIIITRLENCFNDQIKSTYKKYHENTNHLKMINFFGKTIIDLRLSLYNYYKTIFENELIQKFWINLSILIDNEKWEKRDLYSEYKETFKLFITGELGNEELIEIQNYFVSYNNYELNLPECCLRCIELISSMFVFIQKVPIISYLGFSQILKFILNYCKRCFENIMNGESVNKMKIEKITAYNMILCTQNTYFWRISLERIINYQLNILEKEDNLHDKFVNENMYLLNDENNLEVLLGVKLPIDYLKTIKVEVGNILIQVEQLLDLSLRKLSDIIIERFKNCIGYWVVNNIIGSDLEVGKDDDLKKHKVDTYLNNFIRDLSNLEKTLRKYLKIEFLILNVIERIEIECLNLWKNFLLIDNKRLLIGNKKLNYFNLLYDLFYFHMEITIPIFYQKDDINSEKKTNLSISLLDILFEHFQRNSQRFDEKEILQLNERFYLIRNKLNT